MNHPPLTIVPRLTTRPPSLCLPDRIGPTKCSQIDAALSAEADITFRRWGDTSWRNIIGDVEPIEETHLVQLIRAIAAVEDDAFYMQTKLHSAGLLKWDSVRAFNSIWLPEETDHGRAFRALADRLSGEESFEASINHNTLRRDRRALPALGAMRLLQPLKRSILAGYLVRGMMVESVAIAIYSSLARRLHAAGAPAASEIVRRILLQEGRHLRFFNRGAHIVLTEDLALARVIRESTVRTWRPPGVDLYSRDEWTRLFGRLLDDAETHRALERADRRISDLPGFDGLSIVTDYMAKLS